MTLCEIALNVGIGLFTGLLSGYVVSVALKKKWDKEQQKSDFEADKQRYERFLGEIQCELRLANKPEDCARISRKIECEPVRETFEFLDAASEKQQSEIGSYIKKLGDDSEKNPDKVLDNAEKNCRKLVQYRNQILRYKMGEKRHGTTN